MSNKEGFVAEADNTYTVVLDTRLTEELIEEGFVYEIISKLQTMRKEADFEVMDRIRVAVTGNERLSRIIEKNKEAISEKVLATELLGEENGSYEAFKEWEINKERATIFVARVK